MSRLKPSEWGYLENLCRREALRELRERTGCPEAVLDLAMTPDEARTWAAQWLIRTLAPAGR